MRVLILALLAVAVCPGGIARAQAPVVTIGSPLAGSATNSQTPSFSGGTNDVSDEVALAIYTGTTVVGTPVQTLNSFPLLETWSAGPAGALADGTYTAQASQANLTLETGTSEPVTFTVDTVAPAVSLTAVPSPTGNATPSFGGDAGVAAGDIASVRLKIYAGAGVSGSPVRTVDVTPSAGVWSVGPVPVLEDGTYTAQAEQSDEAGNTGLSVSSTFTVDTVAPAVSLAAVASPTNNATPSFSGNAGVAPGDVALIQLKIYAGAVVSGSPVRTLEVTPSGAAWTSGPVPALEDGTYTAQAEQSDEAHNTMASTPSTFRIDTTPPHITLTSPAGGGSTNSDSQLVEGAAGIAEGDSHSITIKLFAGSTIGAQQTPLETIVVQASSGRWSATVGGLNDGSYTVRAEQSDKAGNTGQSVPATFTVDTVAPVVSLAGVASPTADPTPSFSGNAGVAAGDIASVRLKIYAGSGVSGSPVRTVDVAPNGSAWTAGPVASLEDGTYTAQAEQADEAGNIGKSVPVTFTLKTQGPKVTLTALPKLIGTATPTFGGDAGVAVGDIALVRLKIYAGAGVSGSPVRTVDVTPSAGAWSAGPVSALADGVYTAQAEQSDDVHNTRKSAPSTFTVDTIAPVVSLAAVASPTSDSTPSFSGTAGVAAGDVATVRLKIYRGAVVSGGPVQALDIASSAGAWTTAPVAALEYGTYTAQAEQSDEAGNIGRSEPVSFTILAPAPVATPVPPPAPAHSPPAASFTWFPSAPNTGERVSLVSNSTDASSPIVALAWSLAGDGTFQTGGPVVTTAFSTPGGHVVRLRVVGADGLSSTVTETIPVVSPRASLMQPFPIVRIAGTDTAKGARLKLLTVQAPTGARITVWCRGRGCPAKPKSRVTASSRTGVVLVEFRRFERTLWAGTILEIRVSKPGEIGKYTRFQIRRGKLPERLDTCLSPVGIKPMTCPSS